MFDALGEAEVGEGQNRPDFDAAKSARSPVLGALQGHLGDQFTSAKAAAFSANSALSIVGETDDRRVELRNTSAPWRTLCSLLFETPNGRFRGTGWLAGPSLVVTSGHCVFDPVRYGGDARSVTVVPGCAWRKQPFGVFKSRRFLCTDSWRERQDPSGDVGCIQLDTDIGRAIGWMSAAAVDPTQIGPAAVVVAGYPEFAGSYEHLLVAKGPVRTVVDGRLYYELDTTEGQSGGPVWFDYPGDGAPQVIAVHGYEAGAAAPAAGAGVNSGPLITPELLAVIETWQPH